jgi:hypothetical protein
MPLSRWLWNLPEVLINHVLSLWIGVRDIGRLDSAMCGNIIRNSFLHFIHASRLTIHQCYEPHELKNAGDLTNQFMIWIVKRNLALTELTVTLTFARNKHSRTVYLQRHGIRIKSVTFQEWDMKVCSNAEVMNDLCEQCPNVLALVWGVKTSVEARPQILDRWKQLMVLRLRVATDSSTWSSLLLTGRDLVVICKDCQALTELALERDVEQHLDRILPAPIATAILQVCSPNLELLSMDAGLTAGDYAIVASRFPQLRELRVFPGLAHDAALVALSAGCPKLNCAPVSRWYVSDVGILALARNGAITSLIIPHSRYVTDAGILAAAAHCSLLKSIDFSRCKQFTDTALVALAEGCPLLESIIVEYCSSLTDTTLVAIGRYCHSLHVLGISGTNVTQAGLTAIAEGCPLLVELSACHCTEAGSAIEAMAQHCPRLRKLVVWSANVPAQAVLALAERCPLLETVDVSFNSEVGDQEVTALVHGCRNLKWLHLTRTSVTEPCLRAVRERCGTPMCFS